MKITKKVLREMIEEEMHVLKLGMGPPMMAHGGLSLGGSEQIQGERPKDPDGYEGGMAKNNLRNAAMDATMLERMILDDENLEPWVEEKIAVAASMLNSVARYMRGGRTG